VKKKSSRNKSLEELAKLVLAFRHERDWKQFHNPKDQALSLVLEAAEFLELMQWRNGRELKRFLKENRSRVEEELADVLGWVLLIAHDLRIDLADAFARKVELNKKKYPVEKARGSARKYTEL
jgi:NTP pyrophosphatase (non-canonical NTP hydrolase)